MDITSAGGDKRFAHLVDVAPVGHTDRNVETHPRIAVGPVRHRRIDELRVRHNHRNVVVGQDYGAACPDLLDLPGDTRDFDAVANGDRPFRQDHETADEIAGDILQPEADTDADRAGENRERAEMNAGVLEHDEDADDQDEVADDLRDGVLKGAVEPAFDEKAVEEKTLGARGKLEDRDEQRDQQKYLDEAQVDARERRGPKKGNTSGVDGADEEEDERRKAEDRGDDRDEIRIEFETREKAPDDLALERAGEDQSGGEKAGKRHQPEERDVMVAHVKKRALEQGEVHRFSLGGWKWSATWKPEIGDGPPPGR